MTHDMWQPILGWIEINAYANYRLHALTNQYTSIIYEYSSKAYGIFWEIHWRGLLQTALALVVATSACALVH